MGISAGFRLMKFWVVAYNLVLFCIYFFPLFLDLWLSMWKYFLPLKIILGELMAVVVLYITATGKRREKNQNQDSKQSVTALVSKEETDPKTETDPKYDYISPDPNAQNSSL
mmetsp:Transcript_1796/g.2391  ORF Transcript_1796/g.2391 Transcript_1796/m.2391 type:complete len:112 (+) Transcript_1796:23-358(+)